jgi:hypothetical protein
VNKALIVKAMLVAAIAIVSVFDLLLAAVFLLAWLHYDGTDFATNTTIQFWMFFCLAGPAIACFFPFRLSLPRRLLIVFLVAVVGCWVALTAS